MNWMWMLPAIASVLGLALTAWRVTRGDRVREVREENRVLSRAADLQRANYFAESSRKQADDTPEARVYERMRELYPHDDWSSLAPRRRVHDSQLFAHAVKQAFGMPMAVLRDSTTFAPNEVRGRFARPEFGANTVGLKEVFVPPPAPFATKPCNCVEHRARPRPESYRPWTCLEHGEITPR